MNNENSSKTKETEETIETLWGNAIHDLYSVVKKNEDGKFALKFNGAEDSTDTDYVYDSIWPIAFGIDYYIVVKDGKKGILSSTGQTLVHCEMDNIEFEPFNDIVVMEKGNKHGYFLVTDGTVAPAVFDEEILPGVGDDLIVFKDGKKGYVDKNGNFTEDSDESWFYCDDGSL